MLYDRLIIMIVDVERVTEINRCDETVNIPSTAQYIRHCACFNGNLSSLDLQGSNIIIIEEYAFARCYQLKTVIFPPCLHEICEGAFFGCTKLRIVKFQSESKLKKIGARAFGNCKFLETFDFPSNLEIIGEFAFNKYMDAVIDLTKTKIRLIGQEAFHHRSRILLPPSVSPKSVINCCNCELDVDEGHPFVKRDENEFLYVNGTIVKAKKAKRHFIVRQSVERIGKRCFCQSELASLTIPSSVTKISRKAFYWCIKLKSIHFAKNSRLNKIGFCAFKYCMSLKKIRFPKSLKTIKCSAFSDCNSLENVSFPNDSQLERIDKAFQYTSIKHMSFPPSIKKINNIFEDMDSLESVYVRNELFVSNEEGNAILSRDGRELVCVIPTTEYVQIPDGVCVIREKAMISGERIFIPASVEVIEKWAFKWAIIEFASGSKLRSLDFEAFVEKPRSVIINNENFVTMDNGVVMSLNPRGIVFVPNNLKEINIDPNIEVIYSCSFAYTRITNIQLPKSIKKIFSCAFLCLALKNFSIEEETDIETLGHELFSFLNVEKGCLRVGGKMYRFSTDTLELPPNFSPDHMRCICLQYSSEQKIICPRSSILALAQGDSINDGDFYIQIKEDTFEPIWPKY